MPSNKNFLRGVAATFCLPQPFFPNCSSFDRRKNEIEESRSILDGNGLLLDAERLRGYWTNVGNDMIDVTNGRKPSDDLPFDDTIASQRERVF